VSSKVDSETQGVLLAAGLAFAGWVAKEVSSIRPLKENVDVMREQIGDIHRHILGVESGTDNQGKRRSR
jgi:hypothetical protein